MAEVYYKQARKNVLGFRNQSHSVNKCYAKNEESLFVLKVLHARAQPHTGAQHPHPPPTGRERGQAGG